MDMLVIFLSYNKIQEITNRKIIEIEEKSEAIDLSNKTLVINVEENKKKKDILMQILNKLKDENVKIEELIKMQNTQLGNLDRELANKKEIYQNQLNRSQEMANNLEKSFTKMKSSTLREIENNEKLRQTFVLKENYYIKMILGLEILQKYITKNNYQIFPK